MVRIALVLFSWSCFGQTPEAAVRKVLTDQAAAWNRGDIDTFMEGYDKAPGTTFVGKSVQRGWESVRRNYHTRYPTTEKMGELAFSNLEVKFLGADYATVVGNFHLERSKAGGGEALGVFTLLFHKTPTGWRIIQDHTS